jgi:beta-lactamase class A
MVRRALIRRALVRRALVRRIPISALAGCAALCVALGGSPAAAVPAATVSASSVCRSGSSSSEAAALSAALSSASKSVGDEHGIAVYDLTSGVSCAIDADHRMITASIVKASILAALLLRHQRAGTPLSSGQRALAAEMIEHSDNDAASDLYADIGKADGLQEFFEAAGMAESTANRAWGLTKTTANDQVRLLKLLLGTGSLLSSASRNYELGLMRKVESDQRWGTPYGAADGVTVAVKNGWLYQDSGEWHINSLGVFTGGPHTYVMAVTTQRNASERSGISQVQTLAAAVNKRIQDTKTRDAAAAVTRIAATVSKASATPSRSVSASAPASASPSLSASESASASATQSAVAVLPPAARFPNGAETTLVVLAGATVPGGLFYRAARRRRLLSEG